MKAIVEIFDSSVTLEQVIASAFSADIVAEDSGISIQSITDARQVTAEMVIGNIIKGDDGKSAYQVWLDEGHEGSEADFIAWLQKPAIDAIEEIRPIIDTYDGVVDTLAHSDCSLEVRVAHLEQLLLDIITGTAYLPKLSVKELGLWGNNNLIFTGTGAPAIIPDKAGQFYVNITARTLYYSTGNTSIYDWKNV